MVDDYLMRKRELNRNVNPFDHREI